MSGQDTNDRQGADMSQQSQELASFTLPAGAVCKRNGIPFELTTDTVIRCHPANWPLIRDEFVPTVVGLAVGRRAGAAAQAAPAARLLTDEQAQRVMVAVEDYVHAYAEYRDEQDLLGVEAATASAWPAVEAGRAALEAVLRNLGAAGTTGDQP